MNGRDALAGAGVTLGVSAVCAMFTDDGREALGTIGGAVVAAAAGPMCAIAGGIRLNPRSLAAFAQLHHRGGGKAFVLHYSPRLGVIFLRGLRDNEPKPPPPTVRVRMS